MSEPRTSAPPSRARAIQWANSIAFDPRTVYLDTETTGLGPDAEIIEIAIVSRRGWVLLDTLVKSERPIPAGATAVHGITDEMVEGAPTWAEVTERVEDLLAGKQVCIYNADYDVGIIRQVNIAIEHAFDFEFTCAMKAFSQWDGTVGRYGDLKWHKLDVAAARLGIDPGGHRALADTHVCRLVVQAMADSKHEFVKPETSPPGAAITTVKVMDDLGITHSVPVSLADLLDEYGFEDDEVGRMGSEADRR